MLPNPATPPPNDTPAYSVGFGSAAKPPKPLPPRGPEPAESVSPAAIAADVVPSGSWKLHSFLAPSKPPCGSFTDAGSAMPPERREARSSGVRASEADDRVVGGRGAAGFRGVTVKVVLPRGAASDIGAVSSITAAAGFPETVTRPSSPRVNVRAGVVACAQDSSRAT